MRFWHRTPVLLKNTGENPLTAVDITYSVNGGPTKIILGPEILPFTVVGLPFLGIDYGLQPLNTVTITLESDDDNSNNTVTQTSANHSQYQWGKPHPEYRTTKEVGVPGKSLMVLLPLWKPVLTKQSKHQWKLYFGDCYQFRLHDSGGNGGESVVLYGLLAM